MNDSQSALLIAELLIKKFGSDKITGLLTDEYIIEKKRDDNTLGGTYTRRLKEGSPLTDYFPGEGMHQLPPAILLEALDDAGETMNYSNWHNDKFERIAEIVIRYCEMKKIPIEITLIDSEDD